MNLILTGNACVEANKPAQLARSVQPLLAVCLRKLMWQLGRPQASQLEGTRRKKKGEA